MSNQNLARLSLKELLCNILTKDLGEKVFSVFDSLMEISRGSYEEFTDAGFHQSEIQQIKTVLEIGTRYWSKQLSHAHFDGHQTVIV